MSNLSDSSIAHEQQRRTTTTTETHPKEPSLQNLLVDTPPESLAYAQLVSVALSNGGFLHNKFRRRAWMIISRHHRTTTTYPPPHSSPPLFKQSQVDLDVARTYGPGQDKKRFRLNRFLTRFFTDNTDLDYYQGFHDVAKLVLEVMGEEDTALIVLGALSRRFVFHDAFNSNFEGVTAALWMIHQLLILTSRHENRECMELMKRLDNPFWGVSMLISCFAHDVNNRDAVSRLFDALLVSSPEFSIYLVAAHAVIAFTRRKDYPVNVNGDNNNDDNDEHDPAWAHGFLRRATQHIDMPTADILVHMAIFFRLRHAPKDLLVRGHPRLPIDSVLYPIQQERDRRDLIVRVMVWVVLPMALSSIAVWYFRRGFFS